MTGTLAPLQVLEITLGLAGAAAGGALLLLALRVVPELTLSSHKRVVGVVVAVMLLVVASEIIGAIAPFFRASAVADVLEELVELATLVSGVVVLRLLGSAEREEVAPLRHSAEVDDLTGLSSRSFFRRAATRRVEAARRDCTPLACLVVDVDDFKSYNDEFGHEAGDAALRCVARALRSSSRADDLVTRYGGEEFALLVNGSLADAAAVARRVRQAVEGACSPAQDPLVLRQVTVSLGVTPVAEGTETLEDLIGAADREMYRAKRAGKNRTSVAGRGVAPSADPLRNRRGGGVGGG